MVAPLALAFLMGLLVGWVVGAEMQRAHSETELRKLRTELALLEREITGIVPDEGDER